MSLEELKYYLKLRNDGAICTKVKAVTLSTYGVRVTTVIDEIAPGVLPFRRSNQRRGLKPGGVRTKAPGRHVRRNKHFGNGTDKQPPQQPMCPLKIANYSLKLVN